MNQCSHKLVRGGLVGSRGKKKSVVFRHWELIKGKKNLSVVTELRTELVGAGRIDLERRS